MSIPGCVVIIDVNVMIYSKYHSDTSNTKQHMRAVSQWLGRWLSSHDSNINQIPMNSHAQILTSVSAGVLKDIEGLSGSVGFERAECCGPLPPKLPGSFEPLLNHVFLSTQVPTVQWDKTCSNVAGFDALRVACKVVPNSSSTVYFDENAGRTALLFKYDAEAKAVIATQYNGEWAVEQLPWDAKGVVSVDRSDETFIFVCAHRRRDDRCGYCGPVLVDLIKQAATTHAQADKLRVNVLPCSHIGGHVYAGNVLVYNSFGSVCYGCFCPSDIAALLDSLVERTGTVPSSLEARVRGRMGYATPQ